jgi:CheY-specific phosphatase CheX
MIQVAESVFETMLSRSIKVIESPGAGPASPVTAAIYYAGRWQGALLLECSEQQAREWSARLMGVPEPTPTDARDGLGELTNVLAGNLKPLLPPGVGISIPSIVEGTDYSLRVCGGNFVERVEFSDVTGPFSVTLVRVQSAASDLAGPQ